MRTFDPACKSDRFVGLVTATVGGWERTVMLFVAEVDDPRALSRAFA
jgi:hypothetical protein